MHGLLRRSYEPLLHHRHHPSGDDIVTHVAHSTAQAKASIGIASDDFVALSRTFHSPSSHGIGLTRT